MRAGVIGVGYLGRFHAQKYANNDIPCELVGVYDVDPARAKEVADELGVKAFDTIEALLSEVDAVSVVANTRFHYELGLQVLKAGVHCLMEKPITSTSVEAEELVSLAKEKNVVLQVGHIERVNPAYRMVKDQPVHTIECIRVAPFNQRGSDVDVVMDLTIHDIDLVCDWLGAQPVDVQARGVSVKTDLNDTIHAKMTFDNGAIVHFSTSRVSSYPQRMIRAFSKDSVLELDLAKPEVAKIHRGQEAEVQPIEKADALLTEVRHFVDSVKNSAPVLVSGEQALTNLKWAEKIVEKANEFRSGHSG